MIKNAYRYLFKVLVILVKF